MLNLQGDAIHGHPEGESLTSGIEERRMRIADSTRSVLLLIL